MLNESNKYADKNLVSEVFGYPYSVWEFAFAWWVQVMSKNIFEWGWAWSQTRLLQLVFNRQLDWYFIFGDHYTGICVKAIGDMQIRIVNQTWQ